MSDFADAAVRDPAVLALAVAAAALTLIGDGRETKLVLPALRG